MRVEIKRYPWKKGVREQMMHFREEMRLAKGQCTKGKITSTEKNTFPVKMCRGETNASGEKCVMVQVKNNAYGGSVSGDMFALFQKLNNSLRMGHITRFFL